jgi:hypothetical protein
VRTAILLILMVAPFPAEVLQIGGAPISVEIQDGPTDLPRAALLRWISRAAEAVSAYYGQFPVKTEHLLVRPVSGKSGVFNGTTWGMRGGFTRISVGQYTTQTELDHDWMMTHEFTHLALPDVEDEHHWIEEGLATYVEPIARAQAGQILPDRVWAEMIESMPQGQPQAGDRGLDHTHTWGRTYWGGALFALVADVKIRQCTHNRMGLQDALKAILKQGSILSSWPIENVWKTGDAATGCTVLTDLYSSWKDKPVTVDLDALWRDLGVSLNGKEVVYNDNAPLAAARKAIVNRGAAGVAPNVSEPNQPQSLR